MAKKLKTPKKLPRLSERVTFRPGEGDQDILRGIKRKQGLETDSSAVRFALRFTAESLNLASVGKDWEPRQTEPRSGNGTALQVG